MPVELSQSDLETRVRVHAALADPNRLRIVDLLCLSDLTPSQLAGALGIGSNLVAHHLRILEGAHLIERSRSAGDGRRRYLRLADPVLALFTDNGPTLTAESVLFVCTGNSARSQLAEALWARASDIPAGSAGTHPAADVHPLAVKAGARAGLDLSRAHPRALVDVRDAPGLLVTVCDRAHEELPPDTPGTAPVLHWSIPDPREAGHATAFDDSVRELGRRIGRLAPHVVAPTRPRPPRRTHP